MSFGGAGGLNHLGDVMVCGAARLISIIRRSPWKDYFSQLLCLAMTSDCWLDCNAFILVSHRYTFLDIDARK